MGTGVRKRSSATFLGLPLLDIALGPDEKTGQKRGHAKGVIAIGNIATGGVAIGGIARGVIAIGGIGVGGFVLAGVSLGIVALGGVAFALLAIGGLGVGMVGIEGLGVGYVAAGGCALGYYRLEAAGRVVVVREEPQQGRRGAPRRIYGLTPKGKRQLAKGRAEWASFVQIVGSIVGAPA